MITKAYADFSWQQAEQLLSIDSPTGYTDYAALWLRSSFECWASLLPSPPKVVFW